MNSDLQYRYRPDLLAPDLGAPAAGQPPLTGYASPAELLVDIVTGRMPDRPLIDPMATLPVITAVRLGATADNARTEMTAIAGTLARNPHIMRWQLAEVLWPGAEADLYIAPAADGQPPLEIMGVIMTSQILRDDCPPAPDNTTLSRAWLQSTREAGAKGGLWTFDPTARLVWNIRANLVRRQLGQNPDHVDAAVRTVAGWTKQQAIAQLEQNGQEPGRGYCAVHHTVYKTDIADAAGCRQCRRQAGRN